MAQKPAVTILVGPSGSGKSTLARKMVEDDPRHNTVRLNRDDLRAMLHLQEKRGKRELERHVITLQQTALTNFIHNGYNVVVDDTNLNPKTVERVKNLAENAGATVKVHQMETSWTHCVLHDRARKGRARVGRAVIDRQFFASGRLKMWYGVKPIVIVDVDGTLAQNTVNRSPYDESKVADDPVYEEIAQWVRRLFYGDECEGNPDGVAHGVFIVSGRRSTCGEETSAWLDKHSIPHHHLLMRHAWDSRPDVAVKAEILDEILRNIPKEQIAFVIDDRPHVLNMWRDMGLKIYPAREVKEPF